MKLTAKREIFIVNVFQGMSQAQAYREAYPKSKKWKSNAVESNASTLMKNTKVLQRYEELRAMKVEKAVVTADMVIAELALLAFSDPAKLFNSHGHLIPIQDLPEEVSRTISEVTTTIKSVGKGDDAEPYEVTKIKQHDKKGSLDLLGRHFGIYELDNKLKVEHEVRFGSLNDYYKSLKSE